MVLLEKFVYFFEISIVDDLFVNLKLRCNYKYGEDFIVCFFNEFLLLIVYD